MATCSLFEEDEVCHVTPDNTYIYGLVMQNAESVSSDEEEPDEDVCEKGCVTIAWHPKGKESFNTPENKVLLADRPFIVGDVVRRIVPGQETQCGIVQDLNITCHLHITGTDKFIYNVDAKQLSCCIPLQKYENGFVSLNNWMGRVEDVFENITLVMSDGARCVVEDSDLECSAKDIIEKRHSSAPFCEEYWYPYQQLKGIMGSLCNAEWLNPTLLHNPKNVENKKNCCFYAVVEKVSIRSIYVEWICQGYSKPSPVDKNSVRPQKMVEGEDIERLVLVDLFEHCSTKLGSKMMYTIKDTDVVETQVPAHHFVPYAAQHASQEQLAKVTLRTKDILRQYFGDGLGHHRRDVKKANGASSMSSGNVTASSVVSSVSTCTADSLPEGEKGVNDCDQKLLRTSGQNVVEKGAGDSEPETADGEDADDEYEDIDDRKESDSDEDSRTSSTSEAKRRRREKGVAVSVKALRKTSLQARFARNVPVIKVAPGSCVATEVCYTFTYAKVMWQDGTVEDRIPTVELFPMQHVDELEFFPGSYVVDAKAADTVSEYGSIISCNRFERTCHVKWFIPYEAGKSSVPTEVIKESEVSVYDIHEHPDFRFKPGNNVVRVSGFEDRNQTLQAVGQVVKTDPQGSIHVYWNDGTYSSCYPQDLCIVWDMSEYSNCSFEMSSSEFDSQEESESTSDSWETEEEEWKLIGGEDEMCSQSEAEDNTADRSKDEEVNKLRITKIQNAFKVITLHFAMVSVISPDIMQTLCDIDPLLIAMLKNIVKLFRSCGKRDKDLKAFCLGDAALKLVNSIKSLLKIERANKIKMHLEHVFESSNKNLLDQTKNEKQEIATDTSDLQVNSHLSDLQAEKSGLPTPSSVQIPSKKSKTEDVGTSVDMELGSSVDRVSDIRSVPSENGVVFASGVEDEERDISSRLAAANVEERKENKQPESSTSAALNKENRSMDKKEIDVSDTYSNKTNEEVSKDFMAILSEQIEVIQTTLVEFSNESDTNKSKSAGKAASTKLCEEAKPGEEENLEDSKQNESCVDLPKSVSSAADQTGTCEAEECVKMATETDMSKTVDQKDSCDSVSSNHAKVAAPSEENMEIADPPGMALPQGFFICGVAPDCHNHISMTSNPTNPKIFNAAVRREHKLLKSSLPHGIIVKGFTDRMDLFSVLIDGPSDTPYEDGMFLFDVMLPRDYPSSPPVMHYLSFASDRLNPNLYTDGKVCVSLLGTWSGRGMEVWTDKSNLLQVLVSIQGLILVDEPYYNEAGYEKQRGQQIALENSRMYNETALLKLVESMTSISGRLPSPFEEEVQQRLQKNGPRMIARLRKWAALSESMGDRQHLVTKKSKADSGAAEDSLNNVGGEQAEACAEKSPSSCPALPSAQACGGAGLASAQGQPKFPLLPMSKGFRLTLHKSLNQFETALESMCRRLSEQCTESECLLSQAAAVENNQAEDGATS